MAIGNTGGAAEVLDCFTRVLGSTKKDSVLSGRRDQGQLIKCDDLAASLQNASSSGLRDPQSAHTQFRNLHKANIVGDGANNDRQFVPFSFHELRQFRKREGRPVDSGHEEPLQDDLVEVAIGTSDQETIEFHQQLQVRVIRLGCGAVHLLVSATSLQVYALQIKQASVCRIDCEIMSVCVTERERERERGPKRTERFEASRMLQTMTVKEQYARNGNQQR